MADPKNPNQFSNRPDTEEQVSKGGKASSGSFDEKNSADLHTIAGQKGARAQPEEAKRRGGQNSRRRS